MHASKIVYASPVTFSRAGLAWLAHLVILLADSAFRKWSAEGIQFLLLVPFLFFLVIRFPPPIQ